MADVVRYLKYPPKSLRKLIGAPLRRRQQMPVKLPAAYAVVRSVALGDGAAVRVLQHPRSQTQYACADVVTAHTPRLSQCQRMCTLCLEAEASTVLIVPAADSALLPLVAASFDIHVRRRILCEVTEAIDGSTEAESLAGASMRFDDGELVLGDVNAQCVGFPFKKGEYMVFDGDRCEGGWFEFVRCNESRLEIQEYFEIEVVRCAQITTSKFPPVAVPAQEPQQLQMFLLSGQSNMAGRGQLDDIPQDSCLDKEGRPRDPLLRESIFHHSPVSGWQPAREPMHTDVDQLKRARCGIGPGLAFACHHLHRCTRDQMTASEQAGSVCQPWVGLLPTAVGGSSLEEWDPGHLGDRRSCYIEGCPNLLCCAARSLFSSLRNVDFTAMEVRFGGVLWYQGETDAMSAEAARTYGTRFKQFTTALRSAIAAILCHFGVCDAESEDFPLVTVLITSTSPKVPELQQLRDQQRAVGDAIHNCAIADAQALMLSPDQLHLVSNSYLRLGRRIEGAYAKLTATETLTSGQLAHQHHQQALLEEVHRRSEAEIIAYFNHANSAALTPAICCSGSEVGRSWASFTAGEVTLPEFFSVVRSAAALLSGTDWLFVDLGCGTGKALCAAALELGSSSRVVGYEALPSKAYEAEVVVAHLQGVARERNITVSHTSVAQEDFLAPSAMSKWSQADLIFACATCFDTVTMQGIAAGVQMMREGSVCLVVDRPLECPRVQLAGSLVMRTSWGHANVFAYRVGSVEG